MPEPTLTAEEREKLTILWQRWLMASAPSPLAPGEITYSVTVSAREVADLLTAALTAVPRLALASTMVGEARSKVAEAKALIGYGTAYERLHVEGLLADALAALTGEEGRDGK